MADGDPSPDWNPDRSHPLVTETDFNFLTEDDYYSADEYARPSQSRNQQRRNLYDRIRNAIRDMSFLFEHLDDDDLTRLFGPGEYSTGDWGRLHGSMQDTLALFVAQAYARGASDPVEVVNGLVREGIRTALRSRGLELHDYQPLQYRSAPADIPELYDRFRDGEALSYQEYELLRRKIDIKEMEQFLEVRLDTDEITIEDDAEDWSREGTD